MDQLSLFSSWTRFTDGAPPDGAYIAAYVNVPDDELPPCLYHEAVRFNGLNLIGPITIKYDARLSFAFGEKLRVPVFWKEIEDLRL